jgi:hypothetical protein
MPKHIVKDAKVYLGKYDFSGLLSVIEISYGREIQDATDHDSESRQRLPGLEEWSFTHTSFWDQPPDEAYNAAVGTADVPLTVAVPGTSGVDGSLAYFGTVAAASAQIGGSVGDVHLLEGSGEGDDALVRGNIMVTGAKTVTGDGTGRELGAVAAGEKMYAVLHVMSATPADTLDVIVESDAADAWIGAETTRITFTQATDETYELKTVDGAIADTWWRIGYTIGGVDPSFTFVVALGIK